DAFASDEEQNVVRGEYEDQHEEHEEVQVREETVVAAFMRHVASGVDVDQEADAGDDEDHDNSELVHLEIKARGEASGGDPIEKVFVNGLLAIGEKFADGFERGEEGETGRAQSDGIDDFVWPALAEKAVERQAQQGQGGDDPEIVEHRGHAKTTSVSMIGVRITSSQSSSTADWQKAPALRSE